MDRAACQECSPTTHLLPSSPHGGGVTGCSLQSLGVPPLHHPARSHPLPVLRDPEESSRSERLPVGSPIAEIPSSALRRSMSVRALPFPLRGSLARQRRRARSGHAQRRRIRLVPIFPRRLRPSPLPPFTPSPSPSNSLSPLSYESESPSGPSPPLVPQAPPPGPGARASTSRRRAAAAFSPLPAAAPRAPGQVQGPQPELRIQISSLPSMRGTRLITSRL